MYYLVIHNILHTTCYADGNNIIRRWMQLRSSSPGWAKIRWFAVW